LIDKKELKALNYRKVNEVTSLKAQIRILADSIKHTGRVMNNVLMLGYLLNRPVETRKAFMAAFIHDMARLNDYSDTEHGQRACDTKAHLIEADEEILTAVKNHVRKVDLLKENPAWLTTAILKDADLIAFSRFAKPTLSESNRVETSSGGSP
jgi:HD superfamily phosphohydrolase YqeK